MTMGVSSTPLTHTVAHLLSIFKRQRNSSERHRLNHSPQRNSNQPTHAVIISDRVDRCHGEQEALLGMVIRVVVRQYVQTASYCNSFGSSMGFIHKVRTHCVRLAFCVRQSLIDAKAFAMWKTAQRNWYMYRVAYISFDTFSSLGCS